MNLNYKQISEYLGKSAQNLLEHKSTTFEKQNLTLPSPNYIDKIFSQSDRNNNVLRNLQSLYSAGRLANTGYLSILPVDQGIEHSAGASFAKNPIYFDPENIVKLAIEGGCNGVTSTLGGLGLVSRKYAHKIPFIVKINHNELLTYPNQTRQNMFASVNQAAKMGAVGIGATIYFGSEDSYNQIREVSKAFEQAHNLGLFTILWCYVRNSAFVKNGKNYEVSADLTAQANHLGVTIEADIIKQKLPEINGGYKTLNTGESSYGKIDERIYTELTTQNLIDLARYQVANCYMGKIPLISSGGASGKSDLVDVIKSAVVNKRAGGAGIIMGRKAFQKDLKDGVELLKAVQDVYLCKEITIA
jgi:fructose-bisphosphate aldolase, class I